MGFDDKLSFEASQKFGSNLNKSIEYIEKKQREEQNNNKRYFIDKHIDNECTSSQNCLSINRMATLLQLYNNINVTSFLKEVHDKLDEQYKLIDILNDYIHIVLDHNDDNQFEQLYNVMNIKCELEQCIKLSRNQRDRVQGYINNEPESQKNTNTNTNTVNDTVMTDILDQMHCYLLHTFDMGHRLTTKEKEMIQKAELKENDQMNSFVQIKNTLRNKRKRFDNVIGRKNRTNYSKFVTQTTNTNMNNKKELDNNIHEQKTDHSNDDDKSDKIDNISIVHDAEMKTNENRHTDKEAKIPAKSIVYSFSERINYWGKWTKYFKKYTDLKQEILHNCICKLELNEFIEAELKAKLFLTSDHAKKMKCNMFRSSRICEYKSDYFRQGFPLRMQNLLVIILYTDYDLLSHKFSETFREKIWESRESFYWFGRYLRETVEGYGDMLSSAVKTAHYHGISENMIFTSTIAKFNHPTSTTKQLCVAQRFATNDGIIIALQKNDGWLPCFDCHWISAIGNEEEVLLIGGLEPVQITNIIHCSTGMEYKKYLKSLAILQKIFNGICMAKNIEAQDEEIIKSLLNEKSMLSQYIVDLFDAYRKEQKTVCIQIGDFRKTMLSSLFLIKSSGDFIFINIERILSLFPKCSNIELYYEQDLSALKKFELCAVEEYVDFVATEFSKHVPYDYDLKDPIQCRPSRQYLNIIIKKMPMKCKIHELQYFENAIQRTNTHSRLGIHAIQFDKYTCGLIIRKRYFDEIY